MSKLLEKSMDELCANTVDTVDRIMGRYNVGLEEACSVAGISAIDYSEWKENAPQMTFQEQEIDEHELEMKEKMMEKLSILPVSPVFAEAIERIYEDKPVSPLFG